MSTDSYRNVDRKFNIDEVRKAEDLMVDFEHRATQVAYVMFGSRCGIKETGDAFVLSNDKVRILYRDDIYSEYDNCALEFPFEWLNKTDKELVAMYQKYWDEQDEIARKYKEEQERKKAEEEETKRCVRESNEFQEYLKLKRLYEKYEN